jgi:hypothetical protein
MDAVTTPAIATLPTETLASRRASWDIAAIASFACGLLLIVPYLAGVAAIALAILALRQISQTFERGRRLALAGAALGLLNIIGWTVYFCVVAALSAPGRTLAKNFIFDLTAARPEQAKNLCIASITSDRLEAASKQVMSWGGAKHVSVLFITTQTANGTTTGTVRGEIDTASAGQHWFQLQTLEDQIADFSLQ